ncbi:hypothetical protein BCR42DRAFT_466731 [Absidia repens]|uniref:Phospholipid/glycerol acyltransferase domain-containing protein n=1 Tax=Absidia repens TaxID=90262 RepID=A0A1X2IE95_9FUNG|nr:hypothetical protein BCR42DRAFT_466731 [Absidia repens]
MEFFRLLQAFVYISGVLLLFLVLYRKYGGYRYRCFMSFVLLMVMAVYGLFAAIALPIFGKAGLINYTVARGYYYLGRFFTGLQCTVSGRENVLLSPAVYVCNHQSSLDTMKNRANALKEAKQASVNIHKNQTSVWLFPEGTRGHSTEVNLLPFKKGAFYMAVQARVPIVPVVIANYHSLYSTQDRRFIPGNVNIKVLQPIVTNAVGEDSASIEELSVRVRESMLTALRDISPTSKDD